MKLVDLVEYLINNNIDQLYANENINIDSEAILIYMSKYLSIDSEVVLFTIEETEDCLEFEQNGIKYVQLFPLDYAKELIESDLNLKEKGYSNLYIAERLLDYRERDA